MTEPFESIKKTDHIVDLLPWFVTGTLADGDQQAVEEHLPGCEYCQKQLKNVRQLKNDLQMSYSTLPDVTSNIFTSIEERTHPEKIASKQRGDTSDIPKEVTWGSSIGNGLRSFFNLQWVPAAAVVLIVSQTALLMWGQQADRDEVPDIITGPISERSLTQGMPKASTLLSTVDIQLAFQEGTSEQEFRSVIHRLNGQIVDGPSREGVYVVEVSTKDMATLDEQLKALRTKDGPVRLVERLYP